MMMVDLLADVRDSIAAAQEQGTTTERWKQEMTATLRKRGWWGRREEDAKAARALKDELRRAEASGGAPEKIAELNEEIAKREAALDLYVSRRLDTIWRVNMGQAAQAGAWERGQRSTGHPYVLYRIGPSRRHRQQHEAWDGLLMPKDDPFWSVANPRNGWGCKCYTRFVSEAQRRRYRRDGVAEPVVGDATPGKMPVKTKLVDRPSSPGEAPALRPMTYRNKVTGRTHTGYRGIDPGFEHNPGAGRMEQLAEAAHEKVRRLVTDTEPAGPPVSAGLDVQIESDLGRSVRRTAGVIETVHGADLPEALPVRQDDGMTEGSGRFRVRDGRAVDITMEDDRRYPEIVAAHEIGHYLDYAGLPGDGYQSRRPTMPEMEELIDLVRATDTWRLIREAAVAAAVGGSEAVEWRRMLWRHELFARAYAQWIAWKSGDRRMLAQLRARTTATEERMQLRQWPLDEWLPIAEGMDRLFEAAGWLK